jgi:hypothetical protein
MIPQTLNNLVVWLNDQTSMDASNKNDGRIGSIDDEASIKKLIENSPYSSLFQDAVKRHWYDMKFDGYPIQIKSSTGKAADNFSSKKAILWALTDLDEQYLDKSGDEWQKFIHLLANHKNHNNSRDYWILVFLKTEKRFFLNSLKCLNHLTPNGSNLPFQINWSKNDTPIVRTSEESYDMIVGAYKKSVQQREKQHSGYQLL